MWMLVGKGSDGRCWKSRTTAVTRHPLGHHVGCDVDVMCACSVDGMRCGAVWLCGCDVSVFLDSLPSATCCLPPAAAAAAACRLPPPG